jgi:hypothetical protein
MQDKSTYEIKQWSLEEIQKFHKETPFVIVEDEIAMIGFYPTQEIAQTIKNGHDLYQAVDEELDTFVDRLIEKYDYPESTKENILQIIFSITER